MTRTIEQRLETAQRHIENHGYTESLAHSALAIAQMMHQWMNTPVATAELEAVSCQCQAGARDEFAAAAPELLELVRKAEWYTGERGFCPWCESGSYDWRPQVSHHKDCPAAAILKRFEDK